ncbi:MAG: flippase-like domain-containing protein [Woeseiaceae bacterium]|nr:flippase-like domain-containing protein [Gammaproteobacteria bacterium]NNF49855.1 flippase-like domain-containing protein [Woeseiaceae bacterium]NNK24952.1 flippase-like domain-containing protein [Woeseiaceae bacterium]
MWRLLKPLSWFAGIAGLAVIISYFGVESIAAALRGVGLTVIALWMALTLVARIALAETTVAPLRVLGFHMRRSDAFWVGWLRTFANQVFPAAGLVAYVHAIRRKVGISWSELAALASPQFVLAAAALGVIGLVAALLNPQVLGERLWLFLSVYGAVLVGALFIARGAHGLTVLLPQALGERVGATSRSLQDFAQRPSLLLLIVACHAAAILLRGLRLWLLFEAAGIDLAWNEALLVVVVAESSMLIQLTPGGMGIREGAVLAGALLVGIPAEVAAGVAIVDRMLVIAITAVLTPPALLVLRSETSAD